MVVSSAALASPTPASSAPALVPLLSDNFSRDSSLNSTLWQVNGTVGSAFAGVNCAGCALVTLDPSFSAAGMEIAQVNASYEIGTIQSIASFAPPLTVNVTVKGTVSNGHPFVFGLTNSNATAGVQITGNLDPKDCSNETACNDPATCGIPANPSIPPNQCYYGIYARVGNGNGSWPRTPRLNSTPSVGLDYALQVSVDSAGSAQLSVSQGGALLGKATASVGEGPFYLVLAQSEGAPVPGHGPNQAYWLSASVAPYVPPPGPSASSPSSSGWLVYVILILAIVIVVPLVFVWNSRRRGLTVTVLDAGTLAPVSGAGVWADGPKNFSGSTTGDGRIAFGGMKAGDYSVKTSATGYAPSPPVTVSVQKATKYTVRLAQSAPRPQEGAVISPSPGVTVRPYQSVEGPSSQPIMPTPAPLAAPPTSAPSPAAPPEPEGVEGWGGERIRQVIEKFRAAGALSPETALTAEQLGLSRLFVRIMKRRRGQTRVFVEVNGRYYLDERALREMR